MLLVVEGRCLEVGRIWERNIRKREFKLFFFFFFFFFCCGEGGEGGEGRRGIEKKRDDGGEWV